jgi:RNA polymerase sigma factor (sigma-70 family)
MNETVVTGAGSRAGLPRVLSDERLARRAVKGDERAFAAIFDRYHQRLYRYCLAIVGDTQDAQDALQNTMVKVLRALPGEGRRIELKPWLYRIAHNESIELLRRRRETRELDADLAAPGRGLSEEVASRERLRLLLADLEELPERQRGALIMRELSGLDFDEIGTALGTSAATARQTVYEARLGLRQMDEGREMTCAAVTRALSDGDGRVSRRRDLRAHLRTCADCRRFREEIEGRERDLAALSPLPAVVAAGLLQGSLGGGAIGGAAGSGGGLAAGLGGGAVKTFGASAVLKGAAAVAVVAAIGVGVADRGGLIDAGPSSIGRDPAATRAGRGAAAVSAERAGGPGRAGRVGRDRAGSGSEAAARNIDAARAAAPAVPGVRPDAAPAPGGPDTEVATGPAAQGGGSASHPHGKGHEKRHPLAAAHGQGTAATHKAAGKGSAGSTGHPAHPAKPPHPSHPAHPTSAGSGDDLPSQGAGPAAPPHEKAAPTGAEPEAAAPPAETGK